MSEAAFQIAFLAEGKLYVKRGAMAEQLVESPFAQGVEDRAAQNLERHGWREKQEGSPFGGSLLWGRKMRMAETRRVRITALTRAPEGEGAQLLYALDTGAVGGLFTYDIKASAENRLFHKQEFRAIDLACHPQKKVLALSMQLESGSASIAVMQPGSRKMTAVTEGDSLDQAPCWVPTPEDPQREVLVYQAAGLGRNPQGFISGMGPYAIHRLDLDKGQFTTVLEDAAWDYVLPKVRVEEGRECLYFIRRPYKAEGHNRTPAKIASDILLFPFRLVRAIFAFLNVFSVFFSGKPLTTAGGPQAQQVDTRFLMLHGRWVDTQKAIRAAQKGQPVALVPLTWELMRMDADGKMSSVAASVLSFDLAPDGGIVYSNGSEIFSRSRAGGNEKPQRVCVHRMIEHVMAFG